MTTSHVRSIADGVYLWQPARPSAGWGLANCGLIASPSHGAAAWFDCPYDLDMANDFLARCRPILGEVPVSLLLGSHGNGDHLWGAQAVPGARIIYTAETAQHISHEPSPAALHALVHDSDPDTVVGWYMREHFGRYDWSQVAMREPFITFRGELEVTVGDIPVQLTQLGPAHTVGDLIAYLPRQRVAFAGDVIFSSTAEEPGDHPVHWSGPLAGIIEGCTRVLDTGATIIVPGHGPVLDRAGVLDHIAYLEDLRSRAHLLHEQGVPLAEAARRIITELQDLRLGLPERLIITVGAEYRHLDASPVPAMLDQVTALAQLAWELQQPGVPVPRREPASGPALLEIT
jgi:glyoxylase-like metal-dependent hydrolase (beta-lactamase superfamily II)